MKIYTLEELLSAKPDLAGKIEEYKRNEIEFVLKEDGIIEGNGYVKMYGYYTTWPLRRRRKYLVQTITSFDTIEENLKLANIIAAERYIEDETNFPFKRKNYQPIYYGTLD
jgi:hypothetical protein